MDTSKLKSFAPQARVRLQEQIGAKLDYVLRSDSAELRGKSGQVESIRKASETEGSTQYIERIAYTWFNRLSALRFIDARGYHTFGCRVITPEPGNTQPEILQLARNGALPPEIPADLTRINDLLDGRIPSNNPQAEVYRHLVLAVCAHYHKLLPFLFEKLDSETELLLPDDLLTPASVAEGFRTEISDEDCADVEIIGWLYQFYISEKKDEVIGKVVKSEDIPAATQLFTPNWIVKYMVQNSLGAQWLATYPQSPLKGQMEYYIEPAEQTDEVNAQLAAITPSQLNPETLTLIDPASGSGHILVEAYELFKAIYLERGYRQRDVPQLILEKNLFGLDIDERAAQLTSFALMMKGRADDRRLFERGVKLNVMAMKDSADFDAESLASSIDLSSYNLSTLDLRELKDLFEHATTFGSLIQVPKGLAAKLPALKKLSETTSQDLFVSEALKRLGPLVQQAELLAAQYDAVVLNPPYMGGKNMNTRLKSWAKRTYPLSKADSYAAFIERSSILANQNGRFGLITMQGWMFLTSYSDLRESLSRKNLLLQMFHTGPGVFPELGAFNVLTTSFVFSRTAALRDHKTRFVKASEDPSISRKINALQESKHHYQVALENLKCIPGFPLIYWLNRNGLLNFGRLKLLGDVCPPKQGMATTNNNLFLRLWFEVAINRVGLHFKSRTDAVESGYKWFPYDKGGPYRKWFGNNSWLVNYEKNGQTICDYIDNTEGVKVKSNGRVINRELYFKEGITYSLFGFENFGVRYKENGFIFDVSGASLFPTSDIKIVLAFLCSNVAFYYLRALAPTVNFQVGDIARLPLPEFQDVEIKYEVANHAKSCIEICQTDWDMHETSWGFNTQPLISHNQTTLQNALETVEQEHLHRIDQLRSKEQELNKIFIEEYRLEGEVSAEVNNRDLSIKKFATQDTMEELVSYAIGCMMGRYSLDAPGLILADSRDNPEAHMAAYSEKVGKPMNALKFQPDDDGIIPVLDDEWFEDDVVARFRVFLRAAFGDDSLEENLRFLEEAIGKKIRKYFVNDFYKAHLQTYKKRPIYWLFQSPKKSFQALVYLHRYDRDTVNRLLNDYLRPYQDKLRNRQDHLDSMLASEATSNRDRNAATKEKEKNAQALTELADWERDVIYPLATQRLEIDLDDGVKQNYPKFGKALAKVPGLS